MLGIIQFEFEQYETQRNKETLIKRIVKKWWRQYTLIRNKAYTNKQYAGQNQSMALKEYSIPIAKIQVWI